MIKGKIGYTASWLIDCERHGYLKVGTVLKYGSVTEMVLQEKLDKQDGKLRDAGFNESDYRRYTGKPTVLANPDPFFSCMGVILFGPNVPVPLD
jgi:hypothetical protein